MLWLQSHKRVGIREEIVVFDEEWDQFHPRDIVEATNRSTTVVIYALSISIEIQLIFFLFV